MSQRIQARNANKRRWITYLWIFGVLLVASLLIYFERTALLYVVATLGVTALLIVVAVADLGAAESAGTDAPGTGSGVSSTAPKLSRQ
jgi:hypothetical protein